MITPHLLTGKISLVTGGARGIGEGIAVSLAEAGATVVIADISHGEADRTAAAIRARGGKAHGAFVDVSSPDSLDNLVKGIVAEHGQLDLAVNNAGVLGVAPLEDIDSAEWDRVMDVNAKGVFFSCQSEVAAMRAQHTPGSIVNIASLAGKVGLALQSHYSASKFAVVGITNSIAKEVAREAITVNAICPGIVGTRMWLGDGATADAKKLPGETEDESWQRHQQTLLPQGTAQTAEDIGRTVVFLALSPHITGQAISVDGGASL